MICRPIIVLVPSYTSLFAAVFLSSWEHCATVTYNTHGHVTMTDRKRPHRKFSFDLQNTAAMLSNLTVMKKINYR